MSSRLAILERIVPVLVKDGVPPTLAAEERAELISFLEERLLVDPESIDIHFALMTTLTVAPTPPCRLEHQEIESILAGDWKTVSDAQVCALVFDRDAQYALFDRGSTNQSRTIGYQFLPDTVNDCWKISRFLIQSEADLNEFAGGRIHLSPPFTLSFLK